jgi:predicted RNase H-like HicB family nuclease
MNQLPYEMVITWSEADQCYLVHLPDFPEQRYRTHGDSYEEAARNGQEVLELLLTPEQKAEAVRIVQQSGKSIAQVAREMGLTASALSNWAKHK